MKNKTLIILFAITISLLMVLNSFATSQVNVKVFPLQNSNNNTNSTFIVGWSGTSLDTLNPYTYYSAISGWILMQVYPTLCVFGPNQTTLHPYLASSWQIFPNNDTAIFHLNPNAKWSDGVPITAEDVNYSYTMAEQNWSGESSYSNMITSISTPNNSTVIFHFTGIIFELVALVNVYIVPYHIWKNVNASSYFGYNTSQPFVSGGPFTITKYVPSQYIELSRNSNFWIPSEKPHIQNLIFQFFTSGSSMFSSLEAGQIDAAAPQLSPSLANTVKNDSNLILTVSPSDMYYYVAFNVYPFGKGNPTLKNLSVREALAHAVNLTALTDLIWHGYAVPIASQFPPTQPFYDHALQPYSYNVSLANEILNNSGFKYGPNGIRESPNGTLLSYTLYVPSSMSTEIEAANILATQYWSKIGVKVTVEAVDTGTLDSIIWPNFTQDMDLWDWGVTLADPTQLFIFTNTAINESLSDSGYMNATYDSLYESMMYTSSIQQMKNISNQLQVMLYQDLPYLPLYSPLSLQAYSKKWTNISTDYPGGPFGGMDWRTFITVEPNTTSPVIKPVNNYSGIIAAISIIVILILVAIAYIFLRRRKRDGT